MIEEEKKEVQPEVVFHWEDLESTLNAKKKKKKSKGAPTTAKVIKND